MKKLLVVGDFIRSSGLTEVIFRLFSRFPKDQYEIEAVGYGNDDTGYPEKQCEKYGWKLTRVIPVTKNPIKHWQWWKKWFSDHRYDIAYFNYSSSWNYLPVVYARKYGNVPKIVCHSHNTFFSHRFHNPILMKSLEMLNNHGKKVLRNNADVKIATSNEAAKWMFGEGHTDDVHISINGIDLPKFQFNASRRADIRHQLDINEDTKLIGFVGALQNRKNPQLAINVFSEYHKLNPDSKFVLLGNGPLEIDLMRQIDQLNLRESVVFHRFVPNPNEWYSAMDALLFTSRYEGFGLVAVEAQISNLPVLASDTNVDLIFASDNIRRMKDLNPREWANALQRIFSKSHKREHFKFSLEKFSVDRQVQNIEKLL